MVEIFLDKNDGEYKGTNETVKVEKSGFEKNFEKIVYTIEYINTYSSFWIWWSKSYLFNVYIKIKNNTAFTYYTKQQGHVLERVESYHSVKHPDVPLILGLKNKYYTKYYTYSKLTIKNSSTGFPDKGFETSRTEDKLRAKLREEDDRVNRIKFLNTNENQKNCHKEQSDIKGKFMHCYTATTGAKRYEDHDITKKELFTHELNIKVNERYFQSVHDKYFDSVCVYRTNEGHSRILLVEFINESTNVKKYYSRQDKDGHYWVEKQGIAKVDTELQNIESYFRDKLAYLIDKKNVYNGVKVDRVNNPSFDKYKHTPDGGLQSKTVYLLYNSKALQLTNETEYQGRNKLTSFNNKRFCEVCVFFIQGSSDTSPVFIHITETSGSKNYWLQKVDPNCLLWKQIDDPKLNEAIAYRLEFKSPPGSYGNNSIQVSPFTDKSFNGFYHTLQSEHKQKKCLVCYNGNLITLKPIDSIPDDKKLNDIQNKAYSSIKIFYSNSTDSFSQKINTKIPIFLELTESVNPSKTHTLFRIDDDGTTWTEIEKTTRELNKDNLIRQEKIKEINYYITKSIIILINKNDNDYHLNLVKNHVSDAVTPEPLFQIKKKITVRTESCVNLSGYKFYKHDLSNINESRSYINLLVSVTALRLFLGSTDQGTVKVSKNHEIKTFDDAKKTREFLYHVPFDKFNKEIYVFFDSSNKIPLLICHGSTYYKPNNLADYFVKWIHVADLRLIKPCDNEKNAKITPELNKITKTLNEINIKNTNNKGYGIFDVISDTPPEGFDGKLIDVKQENKSGLYKTITHKPLNNVGISKLKFGTEEVQGDDGVTIDVSNNKTISVYYQNSDSKYKYPLLIYLDGGGDRHDFFYERETSDNYIRWKKVTTTYQLKGKDDKIGEKVNTIHYNIGKSVIVRVDHKGQGSGDSYPAKLVDNKGDSGPKSVGNGQTITVSKGVNCGNPPPTGYTCFKHTIPPGIGPTGSQYVSGLKFYICTSKYLSTDLPIYYDTSHNHVKVYFYGTNGTSGTSTNPPVDNVPLLVEYGGTHYKPSSRDGYFDKWVTVEVRGENDGRGDTTGLPQTGKVLDEINRGLNTIQLEQTGDSSTGGDKYGLPKTGVSGTCNKTSVDDFCQRVTVTRNGDDGGGNYLKVTHTTNNKGPIGDFKYGGQPIDGIKLDSSSGCNKVEVYYRAGDKTYSQPLLVCITTQGPEATSGCKKWFSRMGVDVKLWNEDDNLDNKFSDGAAIKNQLDQIYARMANYLHLDISKQQGYPGYVQKGSEGDEKKPVGEINVSPSYGDTTYKADNYRYYEHNLKNYYESNKKQIQKQLGLQDQGGDPTLQVRLYIFNNYFLGLFNEDGRSPLTTPLTYGSEQATLESNDPYVYFFETLSGDEDKVPLLVKYGERYFGPIDKDNYFSQWKEYTIETRTGNTAPKIKAALNKITRLLNEIDLQQTGTTSSSSEYGTIQPTDGTDNPLGAKKRVTVTRNPGHNNAYLSVTHSTKNTGCVGTVKHNGSELQVVDAGSGKKWSEAIETELKTGTRATDIYSELTVYYHRTDSKCTNPLLLKISGDGSGSHAKIDALYYERHDNKDPPINWKKVKDTSSLQTASTDGITNRINEIFYNFNKSVKIQMEKHLPNGASTSYLAKLVKNGDTSESEREKSVMVKLSNDSSCSKISPTYKCIKQTVNMNPDISSQVGGLRFFFGDKEVKTYNTGGAPEKSVFYDDRQTNVHVYFHTTNSTVPLMFKYNSQCFRPMDKTNYFTKWVYDSGVKTRHPSTSTLNKISELLNEIQLEKTGQSGGNGGSEQYGLDKPPDVGDLTDFNGNRITVKRAPDDSRKGYKSVTHTTNNRLPIGKIMFGSDEVKDSTSPGKNLSEVVKQDPSLSSTTVNTVTVYYHRTDTSYSTPLMLGFASTNGGGSDTGTTTPKVFYQRESSTSPPLKWVKVQGPGDLGKPDPESKIAQKLQEIRYQIGKSVVIYVEKQGTGSGGVDDGYDVQVVENNGSSRTGPKPASVTQKITVTKSENCTGPDTSTPPKNYTCYTHTIPALTGAADHTLIGGVKFYVCTKNQYLPTFGKDGYPSEPIYYNSGQQTVTVYFYSNGHGPPDQDKVPLLVKYGTRYYRPSSRFSYFTSWDRVDVQAGQSEGDAGTGNLQDVLDTINKELNAIDLEKTGTTDGNPSGYGLSKPGGTACPCSNPTNFCDRVNVKCEAVNGGATRSEPGGDTAAQTTLFYKVTHATTNKGGIGSIYSGGQVIKAIKTTETGSNSVCNQVEVYYDATDDKYKTPLLLCLGQQTVGQATDTTATNTQCKTWFKRTGIDVTQWEAVGEDDTSNYGTDESIQKQLQSIIGQFNDYLYVDIGNQGKSYDAYVQAKTKAKQKVERTGDDGGADNHKIQVKDANTDEGGGTHTTVPDEYKAYKHELAEFYNGAKKEINKALNPASENHLPEDSGESQGPELHLRLQVGGRDLTLLGTGDSALKTPLQYGKEQASESGDTSTPSKYDLVVYFYGKGGGNAGSNTDWVPLLFQYGGKHFGPKDRHSYFHRWCEYEITGSADGAQNTALKTQLDNINRQLNEIDLTQTGSGSRGTEYGLDKGGATLTGTFSASRITVKREEKVVSGTTISTFTTISHTTTNGYNIGPIKALGTGCKFDNQHSEQLARETHKHDQAIAVYGVGASDTGQAPQLVLIAQSTRTSTQSSNVLGYYDLSSGGCPNGGTQYKFEQVTQTFTVGELTNRETIQKNCEKLVEILTKLNIVAPEVQRAQAASSDSAPSQEDDDPDAGSNDESQDDRPKATSGHTTQHGLGGSAGMGAGAMAGLGAQGSDGQAGKNGETGPQGPRGNSLQRTEQSTVSSGHTTITGHRGQSQEQVQSGGGGSGSSASAQASSGGSSDIGKFFEENLTYIAGGGGAVGGVGVIGGVGAVVYKK